MKYKIPDTLNRWSHSTRAKWTLAWPNTHLLKRSGISELALTEPQLCTRKPLIKSFSTAIVQAIKNREEISILLNIYIASEMLSRRKTNNNNKRKEEERSLLITERCRGTDFEIPFMVTATAFKSKSKLIIKIIKNQ